MSAYDYRHRLSFLLGELYDELEKHMAYLDNTDTFMVIAEDMHRRFGSLRKTVEEAEACFAKTAETTGLDAD